MPINYDDYLSTSVRWALFKADWPDATVDFSEGTAADVNIPATFTKKDEKLCIAKVSRFTGDDRVITAFKSQGDVRGAKDTDSWHALCSKAMGRALKKAGYPDTMTDLKILMKFRDAKDGVKKVNTPEVTNVVSHSVSAKASNIGGVEVSNKVPAIESKEAPVKEQPKPLLLGWKSDVESSDAHTTFKTMCADLTPDELETLREQHEKLNNRIWPMPKEDLNNLIITLQGIRNARKDEAMVASNTLVSLITLLSDEAQKEIVLAFGDPSSWDEMIPEVEYAQILDMYEAVSRDEE
jgi:hypothetical protein